MPTSALQLAKRALVVLLHDLAQLYDVRAVAFVLWLQCCWVLLLLLLGAAGTLAVARQFWEAAGSATFQSFHNAARCPCCHVAHRSLQCTGQRRSKSEAREFGEEGWPVGAVLLTVHMLRGGKDGPNFGVGMCSEIWLRWEGPPLCWHSSYFWSSF